MTVSLVRTVMPGCLPLLPVTYFVNLLPVSPSEVFGWLMYMYSIRPFIVCTHSEHNTKEKFCCLIGESALLDSFVTTSLSHFFLHRPLSLFLPPSLPPPSLTLLLSSFLSSISFSPPSFPLPLPSPLWLPPPPFPFLPSPPPYPLPSFLRERECTMQSQNEHDETSWLQAGPFPLILPGCLNKM